MYYGVSHLIVPVTDLQRTIKLWSEAMGFSVLRRGDGYADIDSGNVAIRLMQVPAIESRVSLRIPVRNVQEACQILLRSGATPRYEPTRTPELEEMACVDDPDGHALILWRELTEDEWGFTPALPTQGEWQAEAEQLLQRLLSHVPALFRMLARRKTTRVIEQLARENNSAVTREIVIKGYITASAKVTRYRLVGPLRAEGIDPDDYREEFDYE